MPDMYDKDFLKIYRIKKGYSMEEVAEKAKMSRQRYSRIEANPGKFDFDIIVGIMKILEISFDNILFFN